MRLDVDGACHKALSVLADAPATMGEMRAALGLTGKAADKFQWPITSMVEARLIHSVLGVYQIRDLGTEALAELNAGRRWVCHPQAGPTVRVFDYQPRRAA